MAWRRVSQSALNRHLMYALCSIHVAVAGFTTETTGWIKPESHGGTLLVASDAGCNLKIVVPHNAEPIEISR